MSTVCVSDDETCEKIRVSLEKCEVDEVIQAFVQAKGTGQEIPGQPHCSFRLSSPLVLFSILFSVFCHFMSAHPDF
jgi:hypothetical protein